MVDKNCLNCGKKFSVHPRRDKTAHYCSYKCNGAVSAKNPRFFLSNKGNFGEKHHFWGKHHTELTKKKIGINRKGKGIGHTFLSGRKCSQETIEKRRLKMKGRLPKNWADAIKKSADMRRGKKLSKELIKKCLRRRPMSGLETRVLHIMEKYNLPYKFVGNGEFFVEKKNPDFINTNGEKIAIEVFWKRHKDQFAGGCENWKKEREILFNKNGWKLLFIDGAGLREQTVLDTIKEGTNFGQ